MRQVRLTVEDSASSVTRTYQELSNEQWWVRRLFDNMEFYKASASEVLEAAFIVAHNTDSLDDAMHQVISLRDKGRECLCKGCSDTPNG